MSTFKQDKSKSSLLSLLTPEFPVTFGLSYKQIEELTNKDDGRLQMSSWMRALTKRMGMMRKRLWRGRRKSLMRFQHLMKKIKKSLITTQCLITSFLLIPFCQTILKMLFLFLLMRPQLTSPIFDQTTCEVLTLLSPILTDLNQQ